MVCFYYRTKHQLLRVFFVVPGVTIFTRWQLVRHEHYCTQTPEKRADALG